MLKHYRRLEDLPLSLPLFPLSGVVMPPGARLPLNVFEPRYLKMVADALSGTRLIGMIQPRGDDAGASNRGDLPGDAPLYAIGCAGRITQYAETDDGRCELALTGICRFRLRETLGATTPYRQGAVDWTDFVDDLAIAPALSAKTLPGGPERPALAAALRRYLGGRGLNADWTAFDAAPLGALIGVLTMMCPFEAAEKQALLEAPTLAERGRVLLGLLEFGAAAGSGPAGGDDPDDDESADGGGRLQ